MAAKNQPTDANQFPVHIDVVPLDEESFTTEEQALIQEGRDDINAGRTVSLGAAKQLLVGPQGKRSPDLD